jgi:hypothetical protein
MALSIYLGEVEAGFQAGRASSIPSAIRTGCQKIFSPVPKDQSVCDGPVRKWKKMLRSVTVQSSEWLEATKETRESAKQH